MRQGTPTLQCTGTYPRATALFPLPCLAPPRRLSSFYTSAFPSPRSLAPSCLHRVHILVDSIQPYVILDGGARPAMAKQSCCHKKRLRRGLWSPEEDEKLMNHIAKYGHGSWSSVPKLAGLERCGKSCRLRWINYLRPDLKRGTFSQEEEDLIIHLHSMLGNKWSQIASQLPGRTDNEVKNFWNSYIKKKLRERGIDPATHKPLAEAPTSPACRAVFSESELNNPTTTPAQVEQMLEGLKMPLEEDYWPNGMSGCYPSLQAGSCAFDMGALQQHCAFPAASSSSTLTGQQSPGASLQPWLELGPTDAGDELRWSDYFDGACFQQAAAPTTTTTQQQGVHYCAYVDSGNGKDDDAVHFDVHGLSNWC